MKKGFSESGFLFIVGLCTRHRNVSLLILVSALCSLTYVILPKEKYVHYLIVPENFDFDAFRINPHFQNSHSNSGSNSFALNGEENKGQIVVATVACGKSEYLPTLLKSSVLFTLEEQTLLHFIIFTDQENIHNLNTTVGAFVSEAQSNGYAQNFSYEIQPVWFPSPEKSGINWREMYANCSTQRLFFPSILQDVDSLIYLDTDTIILGNLSQVWNEFSQMNSEQMVALGPDNMWTYDSRRKIPFVGPIGVNAGVTLMNLTRLRQFEFEKKVHEKYQIYKKQIHYADQDLINIIFHDNPKNIKVLKCSLNLIWSRCFPQQPCADVREDGVLILHGAGGSFKPKTEFPSSIFPMIYEKLKSYELNESPVALLEDIENEYHSKNLYCSCATPEVLVKNARTYFRNLVENLQEYPKN